MCTGSAAKLLVVSAITENKKENLIDLTSLNRLNVTVMLLFKTWTQLLNFKVRS